MKKLFSVTLCLCGCIFFSASAQIKFQRTYGGSGSDEGRCVKQTWDGGYIIAGSTSSFGAGATDVYLLKVDSLGNLQWQKTFGGNNIDRGYSLDITSDSGFVICGYTNSFGYGGYDAYVIRTDMNGDTLWTRTYGGTDWDFAYSIVIIGDSELVVAGNSYSNAEAKSKAWIFCTGMDGTIIWSNQYSISAESFLNDIIQTPDNYFLTVGYRTGGINNSEDILLMKVSSEGDSSWVKFYGGTGNDIGNSIDISGVGGYIIGSSITNSTTGFTDFYLVKTDTSGNWQWEQEFVSTAGDYLYTVRQISTGYVTCGLSYGAGAGAGDVSLIFTDNSGGFAGSRSYGDLYFDTPYYLNKCNDSGFIIVGKTSSFNSLPENIYLIKTDSVGNTDPNVVSSVNEIEVTDNILVYPNPAKTAIFIKLSKSFSLESTYVQLSDIIGRKVYKILANRIQQGNVLELPIENIPSGYYLLTLNSKSLNVCQKLIVVK